jgi:Domain of unknown function (DUF4394)
MRRVLASLAALLAVTVSAIAAASAGALHASGELYGLTDDNRLIGFSAGSAGEIESNVKVSGLPAGASLIGIDVRPLDGKLYTVAKVGTTGRLYTVAPETGQATFVATLVAGGTTPIALQGTQFGFDFNPAADALRIVSDAGQNLRALPSDRAAGPVGTTFTDGTLNDAGTTAAGITAAAYTNNDNDAATGTTLYDIDSRLDGLAIQNPPNAGTLVRVGGLGVETTSAAGFDIRTVGTSNIAYASLTEQRGRGATLATLYQVDLATGATTSLGKIGGPKTLIDIAAAA